MKLGSPLRTSALVVSLAMLASCTGCPPGGGGGSGPGGGTGTTAPPKHVEVVLIANKRWPVADESPDGYEGRLSNLVDALSDKLAAGHGWSAIGINESYYVHDTGFARGPRAQPEPIPCGATESTVLTGVCFDAYLHDTTAPPDAVQHFGGNALLARATRLTGLGPERFSYLDPADVFGISNAKEYSVLGRRFRIDGTERVLPIFVVKLPTTSSSPENRHSQLGSAVAHIKSWWVEGDLAPLLIGDTNFTVEEPLGDTLSQDFIEAARVLPDAGPAIEGIWIGKEKKFPGAAGSLEFEEHGLWNEFADGGVELSDHPAAYARFRWMTWHRERQLDSEPVASSLDGPAFTDAQLAWTARSDGTVFVSELGVEPLDAADAFAVRTSVGGDPIESASRPALARLGLRKYLAWRDAADDSVAVTTNEIAVSTPWGRTRRFPAFLTDDAPALATSGMRVYVAWKEAGSARALLAYSDDEGQSWSPPAYATPVSTDAAPALAAHDGNLVIAWIAHGGHEIRTAFIDDAGNLDPASIRALDVYSDASPTLRSVPGDERAFRQLTWPEVDDRLYLAWTGMQDSHIRIMASPDGADWSHAIRVLDRQTNFAPAIHFSDDRFVLGWVDTSASAWLQLLDTGFGGEISLDVRR